MSVLTLTELSLRYPNGTGLGPVSFEFPAGVTGVVGPNGSGKTTLFETLANIRRATGGTALLDNVSISEIPLRDIGFMFEEPSTAARFTARDHLEFDALMRGLPIDEPLLLDVAARFDCDTFLNRRMSSLSQGMARRVYLSAAFMGNPRLLILDEPLNALDIQTTLLLKDEIAKRKKDGSVTLVSSHILSLLDEVADQVVFLSNGLLEGVHDATSIERAYRATFLPREGRQDGTLNDLSPAVSPPDKNKHDVQTVDSTPLSAGPIHHIFHHRAV